MLCVISWCALANGIIMCTWLAGSYAMVCTCWLGRMPWCALVGWVICHGVHLLAGSYVNVMVCTCWLGRMPLCGLVGWVVCHGVHLLAGSYAIVCTCWLGRMPCTDGVYLLAGSYVMVCMVPFALFYFAVLLYKL